MSISFQLLLERMDELEKSLKDVEKRLEKHVNETNTRYAGQPVVEGMPTRIFLKLEPRVGLIENAQKLRENNVISDHIPGIISPTQQVHKPRDETRFADPNDDIAKLKGMLESVVKWFNRNYHDHVHIHEGNAFIRIFEPDVTNDCQKLDYVHKIDIEKILGKASKNGENKS